MALDLPSLPTELVLEIIRCNGGYFHRCLSCTTLRLACKELHGKIVRHFGTTYFKQIWVDLGEVGLNRLLRISQGKLAYHVESVTVNCNTIVRQYRYATSPPPLDPPQYP
jgi:hypothetical protein